MASRSQERAETAISKLKAETGKEALFLEFDLSSFASIRKAADEFKSYVVYCFIEFIWFWIIYL